MKRFLRSVGTLAVVLVALYFLNPNEAPPVQAVPGIDAVADAYSNQWSDVQVSGQGTVLRTLADDRDGDRHQRFILQLDSGQTVLVAHNIDLAPRIESLQNGDLVQFYVNTNGMIREGLFTGRIMILTARMSAAG